MGRWDRIMAKQALFRSSLENFTPNVRVGNQSELGTRAHPFAAYIAQVHRQIHRFWGDGFLADLDRRTGSDPYPRNLVTALEIAIKPDGTLGQVVIARPSGVMPFDAAAIDAVGSAAPFGEPPAAIKSRDGNVYITWHFHRDERQCATDFVNAHILTTPPKPGTGTPLPPPSKPLFASASKSREEVRGETRPEARPEPRSEPRAEPIRPTLGLPRSAGSRGSGIDSVEPVAPVKANALAKVPDEAKTAAERWIDALERSDAKRMSAGSALPFSSGGKTVASDAPGLRAFFEEMIAEGTPKRDRLHFYTLADVKSRLGRAPRGADGDEVAFAWVEQGGEDLILLLEPTDKGWKVVGLER
jgi:TonB family protein